MWFQCCPQQIFLEFEIINEKYLIFHVVYFLLFHIFYYKLS